MKIKTTLYEAGEWEKVLAAKPDDLNSIPKTHLVEEEDCLLQAVF